MRRLSERSGRTIDDLAGDASDGDTFARWGNGVGFASIPLIIGIMSILYESTLFLRGRPLGIVRYHGEEAIAMGIMWLGVAAFMHAHYFWSVSRRYYFVSELLKPASLLMIAGAMVYVVVQVVLYT